eukprot:m.53706 g.53706  ORF g.53706 m.53706 type:complete len:256 (+) comp11845_c0_seq1:39-806(+)
MADDLMSMFATMNTSERSTLIEQFVQVVPSADRTTAEFYLEASNWTLPTAITSFFENGGMNVQIPQRNPQAEFLMDVTIGEGESVPPNTHFVKTWRLRNNGAEPWPSSAHLIYVQGHAMHAESVIAVPALDPGQAADVSVDMISPAEPALYASSWRLCYNEGVTRYFGEVIWAIVTVAEGGTLPLLQQFAAASVSGTGHSGFGTPPRPVAPTHEHAAAVPMAHLSPEDAARLTTPPRFGSLAQHTFGAQRFGAPP